MAAGTVTITETTHPTVKKIMFAWTSGTAAEDGTASGTTVAPFDGEILGFTTIPGAGGDQPTNLYDITIKDAAGHDVLLGAGADRSNAVTQHVARASLAGVAGSPLTIDVAAAGTTKKGTAILYLR